MAAMSPSSSPRLPSPPPMAEDQIGPMSPTPASAEEHGQLGGFSQSDDGASRRMRPGTKAADMADGPPLEELTDIDSPFQLTEYLKALHNSYTHPPGSHTTAPIDRQTAVRLAQPPDGVDKEIWLYELCRFLTQRINSIIVALFADQPPCSAQTCPEMRASEWQYLCAVHTPPKSCCAIDYCCHTLDWAANTLTSPEHFPSRLALGTESNNTNQQMRQLITIFRRVYRIFAHAWFQHRDMFWKVEAKTGLYVWYKTVCDIYNLIPEDNYTIPPEAEGIDTTPVAVQGNPQSVLRRENFERRESEMASENAPAGNVSIAAGNTTKRHRQTPSASGGSVATVIEENEEEEEQPPRYSEWRAEEPTALHESEVGESQTVPETSGRQHEHDNHPEQAVEAEDVVDSGVDESFESAHGHGTAEQEITELAAAANTGAPATTNGNDVRRAPMYGSDEDRQAPGHLVDEQEREEARMVEASDARADAADPDEASKSVVD